MKSGDLSMPSCLGLLGKQAPFDQALQHTIGDRLLVGTLGNVGVRKLGVELRSGDFLVVDDSNGLSLRFLLARRKRRKKSKGDKGTFLHEEEPQILLFLEASIDARRMPDRRRSCCTWKHPMIGLPLASLPA